MHHIGQCRARVLIISARRQFPPGAPVAGSLIYRPKGWSDTLSVAGYRLRNKGTRCDNAETNSHAGLAFGPALYDK